MCLPAPALALVAAGVSAAGKGYSALVANAQARGVKAQARVNQQEANASAIDALNRANQEQIRNGRKVSATIGAQRAAMAANGIDPDWGSAEDLVDDTRMIGREDSLTIAENGEREARSYAIQGANALSQARSAKAAASGALVKGVFDVGSTILGGATQYARLKSQLAGGSGLKVNFGPSNTYGVSGSGGIY